MVFEWISSLQLVVDLNASVGTVGPIATTSLQLEVFPVSVGAMDLPPSILALNIYPLKLSIITFGCERAMQKRVSSLRVSCEGMIPRVSTCIPSTKSLQ